MHDKPDEHRHPTTYFVDGEQQSTREKVLTPTEILRNAGIDPEQHYLIELRGNHEKESYQGRPNEPVRIHQGMRFISASTAPTPVS